MYWKRRNTGIISKIETSKKTGSHGRVHNGMRILGLLLTLVVLTSQMPILAFAEGEGGESGGETYTLEASALTAFSAGDKADGDSQSVGDFFTILWSAKSKVDSSTKEWSDGYTSGQRINFGGSSTTEKNSIKFTTGDAAEVKIWWVCGGADRYVAILDSAGNVLDQSAAAASGDICISDFEIENAGTYYIANPSGNNYLFKAEVITGAVEKPERADFANVEAPSITGITTEDGTIKVTVSANVGYDGADKVSVTMTDADGNVLDTKNSGAEKTEHELSFTPSSSGSYIFGVKIVRDEVEKEGQNSDPYAYTLPLSTPSFKSATNLGGGDVALEWDPVKEAEFYEVTVDGTSLKYTTTAQIIEIMGFTVGETYLFNLVAVRGNDRSEAGTIECTITNDGQTAWAFSAFGSGVNQANNGYEGNANNGEVRVYSTGGKGKLVPASTDGLAFYYTKVDPKTTNFTLSATAEVLDWTYSNGQEGFGLMAADAVGLNYDSSTFWNNSYMASVTKVEYLWDGEKVSDAGDKISMKLGVGSQEKKGVTKDNITEALVLKDMELFSSKMTTLDTSCAEKGAGTYNIVGNYTNASAPTGTADSPLTEFKLKIQKNNTGYFVSYTTPDGQTVTEKYYDTEALNHLDADNVYAGFFASRNANIRFKDISFTTIDPKDDAPAETQEITYMTPSYQVESATVANNANYSLVYIGNADGTLKVTDADGNEIFNGAVVAGEKKRISTTLVSGDNTFYLSMTPNADYKPSENELLSSYDTVNFTHTVSFAPNEKDVIYVSPNGKAGAEGTKNDPQELSSALQKAVPGQTIYMMEGTYKYSGKLIIDRGIDGTAEKNINLFADPDAKTRPVIDFEKQGSGMVLAGNYWHLKGFDVTGSRDGDKGLQVSGKNNTLELLETYKNGNTGLQISRYKGTDGFDEWPSDNLILNCTSRENADKGYEDADGFAAKLTIGNGNVFDGCIAAYNADDGWDLFAKLETGPIGKVVIKNSVAYKNGYVLDENGNEVNAGNGNGFKMGGESITGYHTLINSVAFSNKAKGIDSNSCPDIQVQNSTSFDNESYNVAFYTNTALNTDFAAAGLISYKKTNTVGENIKPKGSQEENKIYGSSNYYYNDGTSKNSEGTLVTDDWFVSLDADKAIHGGITRNNDGSINMNGFLQLKENAPKSVGAIFEAKKTLGTVGNTSNPGQGTVGNSSNPNTGTVVETQSGNVVNGVVSAKVISAKTGESRVPLFVFGGATTALILGAAFYVLSAKRKKSR